jgi:hypothetical protein
MKLKERCDQVHEFELSWDGAEVVVSVTAYTDLETAQIKNAANKRE